MKLRFGICGLALVGAAFAAPQRIGHATQAQIEAVLPASLRVKDKPDPAGEARYARLERLAAKVQSPEIRNGLSEPPPSTEVRALAAQKARPILLELDSVLRGPLWRNYQPDPAQNFPKEATIKALAKVIQMATLDAAERKDSAECLFYASLGLRLGNRLVSSGGGIIEFLVAEAVEAIGEKSVLDADGKGGFDGPGRIKVLALLPPISGPIPETAAVLRREFMGMRMPLLIDPIHGYEKVFGTSVALATPVAGKKPKAENPAGNYDPIATARLVGRIYDAAIADTQRPFGSQTGLATKLAAKAEHAIPSTEHFQEAAFRRQVNAIPNSIGLQIASMPPVDQLAEIGARRAARRNLTRAVILLRQGSPAVLPDPFVSGFLKVDPKRRIVWSVGKNRKDDGGMIERDSAGASLDMGYRY